MLDKDVGMQLTNPAVLLSDHRVETCSNENNELRRKVETLECTNK